MPIYYWTHIFLTTATCYILLFILHSSNLPIYIYIYTLFYTYIYFYYFYFIFIHPFIFSLLFPITIFYIGLYITLYLSLHCTYLASFTSLVKGSLLNHSFKILIISLFVVTHPLPTRLLYIIYPHLSPSYIPLLFYLYLLLLYSILSYFILLFLYSILFFSNLFILFLPIHYYILSFYSYILFFSFLFLPIMSLLSPLHPSSSLYTIKACLFSLVSL